MKVRISIFLKEGVLDTQGKAIEGSLVKDLGFSDVSKVRQGKLIDLEIAKDNQDEVAKIVDEVCDKLLVNQVIEDYTFEVIEK